MTKNTIKLENLSFFGYHGINQDEIKNGRVTIKNMEDGTQTDASIDEIENHFGVDYEYK